MTRRIGVAELHRQLTINREVALLDVREEFDYAQGHILLATLLPLSQLELRIAALVPRRATPVVLVDRGDAQLTERASVRLGELGYNDVAILKGGTAAWRAAGHQLFTTTHVLAKTFGGIAERNYQTPRITAAELKQRIDAGGDVAIFDARTYAEFQAGSLPGAQSCPLAELVDRVPDAVPSRNTLIVVNCASRTRGIVGAQSLLNLGLHNDIAVLENGVMAWSLAGGEVVAASGRVAPAPDLSSLNDRRRAATQLADRYAVPLIDRAGLRRLENDQARSLYVFDVRTPEAYEAGHWRDARSAPGGQLVMTVLQFIGTHRSRVVLLDGGEALRAVNTAIWLKQIGRHDVYVLAEPPPRDEVVSGPAPSAAIGLPDDIEWIEPEAASALLKSGEAAIIDVDNSLAYREAHIPGARFAIRARLPAGLENIAQTTLILTSADGQLAALAAADLRTSGRRVVALRGGTSAWRAAWLPVESGNGHALHPFEDIWHSPMRETERKAEAYAQYLAWEISLADQVGHDDTVAFALPFGHREPKVASA
ncbi:MAG: rhodanese-like domain-containing protein [Pseudolabrys sp.]|nr:rhodanese-like domain-containing protein [Pseudolabrys sp.]